MRTELGGPWDTPTAPASGSGFKPVSQALDYDFAMKGVEPDKTVKVESADGGVHTVYLWTTPLKEVGENAGK